MGFTNPPWVQDVAGNLAGAPQVGLYGSQSVTTANSAAMILILTLTTMVAIVSGDWLVVSVHSGGTGGSVTGATVTGGSAGTVWTKLGEVPGSNSAYVSLWVGVGNTSPTPQITATFTGTATASVAAIFGSAQGTAASSGAGSGQVGDISDMRITQPGSLGLVAVTATANSGAVPSWTTPTGWTHIADNFDGFGTLEVAWAFYIQNLSTPNLGESVVVSAGTPSVAQGAIAP